MNRLDGARSPISIRIRDERIRALKAFREDALGGGFPGEAETVGMDRRETEGFRECLERQGP